MERINFYIMELIRSLKSFTPTLLFLLLILFASCSKNRTTTSSLVPEIDGEWWQVAGNPDLCELSAPEQQPVDFGIWQAADGSWQLWSCIRKTRESGATRLFHRWEGKSIKDRDWTPMGIAMRADTSLGETAGGLQAPYVIKDQGKYYMFYGDWNNICLAISDDGKNFNRVLRNGSPRLFGDLNETNTRDPMLIKTGGLWYCYYTAHPDNDGAIYVRTSPDFYSWSDSEMVSYGGSPGKGELWFAECPHVIQPAKGPYFLFRTFSYGNYKSGKLISPPKTNIYRSENPKDFGIDNDNYLVKNLPVAAPEIVKLGDQWYIAALKDDLQGIRIARLKWIEATD
jgi:hypothetical protein